MNATVRTTLFWAAFAIIAAANIAVALQSLLVLHFWEDEAFNLTVPLNLLDGLGYTSDGALSGSTLTPFDPRISTGPSVLLPAAALIGIGLDPVIGARLVPLMYWILLLVGLWVLGRRIAGRWAALLAIAVPLAFDTSALPSPIQGPADLLGEIPAAALLVWALVVLPRRAWLAGLLVGLAVQAKLIALLALPAFAVALWALTPGSGRARITAALRRSWLPLVLAGTPTLVVEVAALITLGPSGFIEHLRDIARFVRSGGQNEAPTTVFDKLSWFIDSWHVPVWAVLIAALVGAALIVTALVRHRDTMDRDRLALLLAASVGLVAFLGWWATAAHTPLWVRHPSPGVFAFLPVLAAFTVWAAQVLWSERDTDAPRATRALPGVAVAASLAVALVAGATAAGVVQHGVIGVSPPTVATLPAQRESVAELAEQWADDADPEWLAAEPWGSAVPMIVMLGAHVGLFDAEAMRDVTRLGFACAEEPLAQSGPFIICPAP
ncbi:glycosyltransferase family 87 protein [Microbacterium sp. 3J1]|uniref:glycosyltransferase family 87 protein n=1 Tax=Microbacterium sp. 3J1 TaxID=861269 RepID=UPI000B072A4E|nr:glycosyltransferase family 87 protein [Microbacterium sp. 3J1]